MTKPTYDAYCQRCDRPIRGHGAIPQLCIGCGKAQQENK